MKNLERCLILLSLLISSLYVNGQTEFATIELDKAARNVKHVQQISDNQGNTLLCFQHQKSLHFVLIRSDNVISSQNFKFKRNFAFVESFYDEEHFYSFYRDTRKDYLYLYKTDKQSLASNVFKFDEWQEKESHLSDIFYQGEFILFNYSTAPYELHTYRYLDGIDFDKSSQHFENHKKEKFFLGQIITDDEFISVRLTLNPLTFHFYRFFGDDGFEKRSVPIRPLYEAAGIRSKSVSPQIDFLVPDRYLNAFVEGDKIYLDLEYLLYINSLNWNSKRQNPGVLKLDWQNGKGEVLMTQNPNDWNYKNKRSVLHDSLYFQLMVNNDRLDLSVFNIKAQTLFKSFSYSEDQEINLILGQPNWSRTSTIYLDLFSSIYIPIDIKDKKPKKIDNKKLLRTLSGEDLFLDVYSDASIIELHVSGVNFRDVFIEQTDEVNFVGYLSKPNLEIISEVDKINDPTWEAVDEFISDVERKYKKLGEVIAYESAGNTYLVYTIKKTQEAKIIRF